MRSTLSRYFLPSLLTCLFHLPRFLVFWYRWLAWKFLRNAYSLGSLGGWSLYLSSSSSGLRVEPGFDVCMALFSSLSWAFSSYSILGFSLPTTYIINNRLFQNLNESWISFWKVINFKWKKKQSFCLYFLTLNLY